MSIVWRSAFLGVLIVFIFGNQEVSAQRLVDSLELVELYNATDGPNWTRTWDLNAPMDDWDGVRLTGDGEVQSLSLSNNALVGAWPDLVLPELLVLDATQNQLNGTFPQLTSPKLTSIDFSFNAMRGVLPDFSDFPALISLRLQSNLFRGQVPEFSTNIGIAVINLSNNSLTGVVPNFSNLSALSVIRLSDNMLVSTLPNFNLPFLVTLDLSNNQLSGEIGNFSIPNIISIDLSNNQFTGDVPGFNNAPLLSDIALSNNQFTGQVPPFAQSPELTNLFLDGNELSGILPSFFRNDKMQTLNLSNNNISGAVVDFDFPVIRVLDISNNNLGDTIPAFEGMPALREFYANNNDFNGALFDADVHPDLTTLEVQDNRFTFTDLLAMNAEDLASFIYGPQASIPMPDTLSTLIRSQFLIDLGIDGDVSSNNYTWFKQGLFIRATASNTLTLFNVSELDTGSYHAQVRNTELPALNLFSDTFFVNVECPLDSLVIDTSICQGDTLFINNVGYTQQGTFQDTILVPDAGFCDSLLILNLNILPSYDTVIQASICGNETFLFGDTVLSETGNYIDRLVSVDGCDSIVRLTLVKFPSFTEVTEVAICAGETLFVDTIAHSESGIYFDTLRTVDDCDSIIITDLIVVDSFFNITEAAVCPGDTFFWRDNAYSESGTFTESFVNQAGCDSTYQLRLFIPESTVFGQSVSICGSDSLRVGANVYRESGIYRDSLVSSIGCDSIVVTNLVVEEFFNTAIDAEICQGDTLIFADSFFTAAGIYFDTLTARGGCDSIIRVRLNVVAEIIIDTTALLCAGDSLEILGRFWMGNIDTVARYPSEFCDTIVSINLTELAPINTQVIQTRYYEDVDLGGIEIVAFGGVDPFSYEWNLGVEGPILDSVPIGAYTVDITDAIGCTHVETYVIDITTNTEEEGMLKPNWFVYPNPMASDQFFIRHNFSETQRLSIYSSVGQLIHSENVVSMDQPVELIGPPGIYTIVVSNGNGERSSTRIVKY